MGIVLPQPSAAYPPPISCRSAADLHEMGGGYAADGCGSTIPMARAPIRLGARGAFGHEAGHEGSRDAEQRGCNGVREQTPVSSREPWQFPPTPTGSHPSHLLSGNSRRLSRGAAPDSNSCTRGLCPTSTQLGPNRVRSVDVNWGAEAGYTAITVNNPVPPP